MTAPVDLPQLTAVAARIPAIDRTLDYKYFGDYEMSDDQREAVDACQSALHALPALIAELTAARERLAELEPVLISREIDADCGCPEEYWDAYGLHLHMHLNARTPSNGHADGGDYGEASIEVIAATIDLARAAIFGWAKQGPLQ